jgi:hypothetical protein
MPNNNVAARKALTKSKMPTREMSLRIFGTVGVISKNTSGMMRANDVITAVAEMILNECNLDGLVVVTF